MLYSKKRLRFLGLGEDLDALSPLELHSELTKSLDLDLDLDREQLIEVAVWSKLTHDLMVDLLRPIAD